MAQPRNAVQTLRNRANRRGLELRKARTRDPQGLTFGRWMIIDTATNRIVAGGPGFSQPLSLADVEAFLNNGGTRAAL